MSLKTAFDYKSIESQLCSPQTFVRIIKELDDVNDDFKSLRTVIKPTETVGVLHFVQYPADGALADKPIYGRIIITKLYPTEPPIVHIFTKVNRYNVDVFNDYAYKLNYLQSSVCFDIVKPSGYGGGTWAADITISALLASLLQSIVSISVPQMHGPEEKEFVSMEKLNDIYRSVEKTYKDLEKIMPVGRVIEKNLASPIDTAIFRFRFDKVSTKRETTLMSELIPIHNNKIVGPFNKERKPYSIGIDLSDLQSNKSTVFSIVLTTDPTDLTGKKPDTILFRNGVTGTAAKKEADKKTIWFYHGIPLNDSDLKIIVTVTDYQFTISYLDIKTGRYYIHGDYPIAYFREDYSKKFYLCLYLKNKNGGHASEIKLFEPEVGYVQNTDDFEMV